MEHFWENVQGYTMLSHMRSWNAMMDLAPQSGTWVEIGSWLGKSAAYCAVELQRRNMSYRFHCVDTWEGSIEHQNQRIVKEGKLYDIFSKNIAPIRHLIEPHRMTSELASKKFDDESIDVLFVDGDHTYEGVTSDLENWIPKMKSGGVIGYDDYPWESVRTAIHDYHNKHGYPLPEDLGQVYKRVAWWQKP